jgi:hypothetical protein
MRTTKVTEISNFPEDLLRVRPNAAKQVVGFLRSDCGAQRIQLFRHATKIANFSAKAMYTEKVG